MTCTRCGVLRLVRCCLSIMVEYACIIEVFKPAIVHNAAINVQDSQDSRQSSQKAGEQTLLVSASLHSAGQLQSSERWSSQTHEDTLLEYWWTLLSQVHHDPAAVLLMLETARIISSVAELITPYRLHVLP